jgi:hypothetical protein
LDFLGARLRREKFWISNYEFGNAPDFAGGNSMISAVGSSNSHFSCKPVSGRDMEAEFRFLRKEAARRARAGREAWQGDERQLIFDVEKTSGNDF